MTRLDLSECAARLNAVHEAWMANYRAELRKNSWRDIVKKNPDRFKIERGFLWEKNTLGVWNAIMSI